MIYAVWYGGSSYGPSDTEHDLEAFTSLEEARRALNSRRGRGAIWVQDFDFVNREPQSVYCPCVEDSSMHVWFAADEADGGRMIVADYPDRILTFGPRGGVVVVKT